MHIITLDSETDFEGCVRPRGRWCAMMCVPPT
jgi:hypothetical protein